MELDLIALPNLFVLFHSMQRMWLKPMCILAFFLTKLGPICWFFDNIQLACWHTFKREGKGGNSRIAFNCLQKGWQTERDASLKRTPLDNVFFFTLPLGHIDEGKGKLDWARRLDKLVGKRAIGNSPKKALNPG